jgi:Uma2 family endonuclease
MHPVSERHDDISRFLDNLFQAYLEQTGGGRVLQDPMVMRPASDLPARSPDIQVLLPDNLAILRHNEVAGAANVVVEIVSPESQRRDRVEKFNEYERGGVQEYWIIDPTYQEALFYQLGDDKLYVRVQPDDNGVYNSTILPKLQLQISLLWSGSMPGMRDVIGMVEAMLAGYE